jgi:hypothetical protein
MKKLFLILAILVFAVPALADWSVTVTWTRSVGPNLASEQVFYSGVEKCSVSPAAPTTCNFVVPALGGSVIVRSTNSQGAFSETAPVVVADQPAPASGVTVQVIYVAP